MQSDLEIIFDSFNSLINTDPTAIEVFNEKYDEKQLQRLFKTYRETEQLENSASWVSELFDTLLRNENDPSNQPFMLLFYVTLTDYVFGVICKKVDSLPQCFHWFEMEIPGYQSVLQELLEEEAGNLAMLMYSGIGDTI